MTGDGKDSPSQLVINCTDKSKTDIVERAGKRYLTINKHFLFQDDTPHSDFASYLKEKEVVRV